jgi:hypothetical protein
VGKTAKTSRNGSDSVAVHLPISHLSAHAPKLKTWKQL